MECNGFTEEIQSELGKDYSVIFEPRTQQYEVLHYNEHEKREITVLSVPTWGPEVIKDLRMYQYETFGMDEQEYHLMREKKREIEEKHTEKETRDWAEETAHSLWHSTGKRVF